MRHLAQRGLRIRQQPIAGFARGEIADPGHRQFRPGRGCGRRPHGILAQIGEQGSHALADQRLCDRATDAVARAGHQSRLTRGIEWSVEQAHGMGTPYIVIG
jgi:hypothetical protein